MGKENTTELIKKSQDVRTRQASFSSRYGSLLKKAHELAILRDAEMGVFVFSKSGRVYNLLSTSDMKEAVSRYQKISERQEPHQVDTHELDTLKKQVSSLQIKQMQLQGKNLTCLKLKDLIDLEDELTVGLSSVKQRREQLLIQNMLDVRRQAEQTKVENQFLLKRVEQLQDNLLSLDTDYEMEEVGESDTDTTLELRLPSPKSNP